MLHFANREHSVSCNRVATKLDDKRISFRRLSKFVKEFLGKFLVIAKANFSGYGNVANMLPNRQEADHSANQLQDIIDSHPSSSTGGS